MRLLKELLFKTKGKNIYHISYIYILHIYLKNIKKLSDLDSQLDSFGSAALLVSAIKSGPQDLWKPN